LASFGLGNFFFNFLILAQMKRIHCKEKQEQQTPGTGGVPLCTWNLNQ
jgi:hypothetical protein